MTAPAKKASTRTSTAKKSTSAKTTSKGGTTEVPVDLDAEDDPNAEPVIDLSDVEEIEIDLDLDVDALSPEAASTELGKRRAARGRAGGGPLQGPRGGQGRDPAAADSTETEAFEISDADIEDEPQQQVTVAGATADPVKDYLKQIGKVALLNAEQEVQLAKRIEAAVAEEKLNSGMSLGPKLRRDLEWIAEDGRRAKNHLLEANLRLVVSLAKRYTGRGMLFLDLIQEGNLGLIPARSRSSTTPRATSSPRWTRRGGSARRSPATADQARTIRIPVHMVEVIKKVGSVQRQMLQDLGRVVHPGGAGQGAGHDA